MLTIDHLNAVDRDAIRAPTSWLRQQASAIRTGLHELDGEILQFAQALLVQLDHLERAGRAVPAEPAAPTYLAPGLTVPTGTMQAAA